MFLWQVSRAGKMSSSSADVASAVEYDDIDAPVNDSSDEQQQQQQQENHSGENGSKEEGRDRHETADIEMSRNAENSSNNNGSQHNRRMSSAVHHDDGGRSEDEEECSTLYIRNLPENFRNEDIKNEFSRFGEIIDCRVVINPVTKESRGFGFVSYRTVEMAEHAKEKMDGLDFRGNARV